MYCVRVELYCYSTTVNVTVEKKNYCTILADEVTGKFERGKLRVSLFGTNAESPVAGEDRRSIL